MTEARSPWGLAWRLARRELRSGLSGFRVLVISLAIGVAAIAAVGTVNESVIGGLRSDARALLGGDVDLRLLHRDVTAEQDAYLQRNSADLSHVTEMRAMARPANNRDARTMVELKAVDAVYPLVGGIEMTPVMPLADALARNNGVWGAIAEKNLLDRLGIAVGDRVKVGDAVLDIRARLVREPDRVASVFNFGPRLMIADAALPETGLVRPGSMIRYHTRVTLPAGTDAKAWTEALNDAFPTAGWRVQNTSEAAPGVRRFVERMTLFLTFAGLTALLVGGIGVGNAVKNYMDGRVNTIATFKCVGAPGSLVFQVYLLQVFLLASIGIAIGLVAGVVMTAFALEAAAGVLPVPVETAIYPLPIVQAAALGLLTAMTFALWPLARARDVPAANLFRQSVAPTSGRPRPVYMAATALCGLALVVLVVATALDRNLAYWFVGGAALTLLIFKGAGSLIVTLVKRLPRPRNAELRLALSNLSRPGTPTPSVVLSLGMGLAVLVALVLIEGNLRAQIGERLPEAAPTVFFIDIQDDQVAVFDSTVQQATGVENMRRVPSLRGRIVRIDGVPVEQATVAPEAAWAVRGDRALTYAATLPEDAKIVAGSWWPEDYSGEPIMSFDAKLAQGFGVEVGDFLTLNVLGREIDVRIASLREIDWRAVPFDFALILAPGTLDGAPHTHIAAVYTGANDETAVEKAVSDQFENITAIRVREALEAVNSMIEGIGQGIRAAASVAIIVGALVVAGAIAAGRQRRQYDAVIFKVLGATRRRIAASFLMEYGLLGLATGMAAAIVGTTVAWAVTVFLMRMPWVFLPGAVTATIVACVILTLLMGFAGTWRVLGQKSSPYLRNE